MPIVLATFALSEQVPHAELVFNTVFFVVIVSTILQGTTLERVARRLGLVVKAPHGPARPLEVAQEAELEIVEFAVKGHHAIDGSFIRELGLPRSALVAVVSRAGEAIPPRGSTVVKAGDTLLVLTPKQGLADLEDVFERWRRRV